MAGKVALGLLQGGHRLVIGESVLPQGPEAVSAANLSKGYRDRDQGAGPVCRRVLLAQGVTTCPWLGLCCGLSLVCLCRWDSEKMGCVCLAPSCLHPSALGKLPVLAPGKSSL